MAGFTYKSYSFVDKDPIIDQIRTVYQESGANYNWVEEHSGVTANTLKNWFGGKTKRPQVATVNAVLRALGFKLSVQSITIPEVVPSTIQPVSVRHVVQMNKYRKAKR